MKRCYVIYRRAYAGCQSSRFVLQQHSSDCGKPDSFRLFTSSVCGSEDFQVVERGHSVKFRRLTMVMGALAKSRPTSWRFAQFRSQVRSTTTWFDLLILWFLTTNADSTRRLRNEFLSNHLSQLACIEGVTSDFHIDSPAPKFRPTERVLTRSCTAIILRGIKCCLAHVINECGCRTMASIIKLDANEHPIKSVTVFKANKAEVVRIFKVSLEVSP